MKPSLSTDFYRKTNAYRPRNYHGSLGNARLPSKKDIHIKDWKMWVYSPLNYLLYPQEIDRYVRVEGYNLNAFITFVIHILSIPVTEVAYAPNEKLINNL